MFHNGIDPVDNENTRGQNTGYLRGFLEFFYFCQHADEDHGQKVDRTGEKEDHKVKHALQDIVERNNIGQRRAIIRTLKAFPLTVTGSLPIEEAMVTGGGVSAKEINPRSMESKVVPGLYFAGELIEGSAASGGYNLQQAFSTGYLAGEKAANA